MKINKNQGIGKKIRKLEKHLAKKLRGVQVNKNDTTAIKKLEELTKMYSQLGN